MAEITFTPVEPKKPAVTFTPVEPIPPDKPKEQASFIEDLRTEIVGGAKDVAKGFTDEPTGIMKSRLGPMLGGASRIISAPFTAAGHWIEDLPAPGTGKTIGEGVAAANLPGARPEWSPRLETPGEVLETAVFGGGARGGLKAGMKQAERTLSEALTPPEIKANPESITARQNVPGTGELSPGFIRAQENSLYQITQRGEADKVEFLKKSTALPAEAKNPRMQEKLYHGIEGGKLTPEERKIFDETIMPLQRERAQLYKDITDSGYSIDDLSKGAHRIAKGTAPHFDEFSGTDPIAGGRTLPRTTSSLQERKYYALEAKDGSRLVVKKLENGGAEIWRDKKVIGEVPGDVEVGQTAHVLDTPFNVKQATTKELEQHTPTEYHKNAWANTVDDLVRLRRVKRALEYLDTLKKSPEWQKYATMNNMRKPPGWRTVQLPQLAGWFMDPKWAAVFDDFYGAHDELSEALAKINRFATRSLFWGPLPHIENVFVHWYTARGFDWITPQGTRSLFQDGARAMHQVFTQGKDFQRMLREGSALQSARVTNQDFYGQMMKKMGSEIERDPERWGPIAKNMGFNKPADFVAALYNWSSKTLWQWNDIFMLQRQFELQRKGMSAAKAIEDAQKHIPPYRVPTEVMGSRALGILMKSPNVLVFSPYHYGIFKSYSNMAHDLFKGTPEERRDTIGNLFALGIASFVIYPYITAGLQKLTGNENVEKLARGAASFPRSIYDLAVGNKDLMQVISSVATLAPGSKAIGELMTNLDWFTGRHVYEPADLREHRYGRVAAQMIEFAAQQAISPYKLVDDYIKDADAKSLVRAAIDQQAGVKEPTDRQMTGKTKAFKFQRREAVTRQKRPHGLLERGEQMLEDTFQGPMQ